MKSDAFYFACLGVTLVSAIVSVIGAWIVVRGHDRFGASIVLSVSSGIGLVCTLPLGASGVAWLPVLALVYFGSVVLATLFCCLSILLNKAER